MAINYRKNDLEQAMLMNLHKKKWTDGLLVGSFAAMDKANAEQGVCVCVCVRARCFLTQRLCAVDQMLKVPVFDAFLSPH